MDQTYNLKEVSVKDILALVGVVVRENKNSLIFCNHICKHRAFK